MAKTPDTHYRPRVLITGEKGGTGASTTARLLAGSLDLPVISGGKYFRALANRFVDFKRENVRLSAADQYRSFLKLYRTQYQQAGLDKIGQLLTPGLTEGAKGDMLAEFGAAVEKHASEEGYVDPLWDRVVDGSTLQEAQVSPGFIWESKLAIIASSLDQFSREVDSSFLTVPCLRVLLELDSVIAAQRVAEREDRHVTVDEIETRKRRDFHRYGEIYTIQGQSVTPQHLKMYADLRVNTASIPAPEVAVQIVETYLEKLQPLLVTNRSLYRPAVRELTTALESFKTTA